MSKQYLYKVKHKFIKKPDLLLENGFSLYEDEQGEEKLYSMPIVLPENGSIFEYLKRALEKIYIHATSEERRTDFGNYEFKKVLKVEKGIPKDDYELQITNDIREEFTKAQLCCYTSGEGSWYLFINAPDHVQYYNAITLEESCKSVIEKLVNLGVVYKVRNRIK